MNTILKSFKVPNTPNLYPIACHGYSLGSAIHKWRLNGARADLLEEIKALGFKPDPIFFSRRDFTRLLKALEWSQSTFGYKERVKTYREGSTCLADDHPTLPEQALGELFHRAKTFDEKVGFLDVDRKKLKVFSSWNSVQSTIYPLMELYFKLHENLDIRQSFLVPCCGPDDVVLETKFGHQVAQGIRTGRFLLSGEEEDVLESMNFKWGPKGRTPKRENKRHKSK